MTPERIEQHKRTRNFSRANFRRLRFLILSYETLQTTSHCVSQASDILEKERRYLSKLFEIVGQGKESSFPLHVLDCRQTLEFGVADSGLIMASKRSAVVTSDGAIFAFLSNIQGRKVYFAHTMREQLLADGVTPPTM